MHNPGRTKRCRDMPLLVALQGLTLMRTGEDSKRNMFGGSKHPLLALAAAIVLAAALSAGCTELDLGNDPGNVFDEMLDDGLDCMKNVDGLTWSADVHNMFDTPSVETAVPANDAPGEDPEVHHRLIARRSDAILIFTSIKHHPLANGGCIHVCFHASYDQAHAELILRRPTYSLAKYCGTEDETSRDLAETEATVILEEAGEDVTVDDESSLEAVSFFVEIFLEQTDRTSFTDDDWGAYECLARST